MKTYAYARVSARDQNLDRQLNAFLEFGVDKNNIYSDKQSGKDFERKNYIKLLKKLREGDLLVIKSIDRLGRNYNMIIDEWANITKQIKANIVVLDMPLLDTRENGSTLIGTFIADIVLQILSFVAENERQNIKIRQAEGIAAAKKKGVRFGRPSTIYTDDFKIVAADYGKGLISVRQAAKKLGMPPSNFHYHAKKYLSTSI